MKRWLTGGVCCLTLSLSGPALAQQSPDGVRWLSRAVAAVHSLNYSGTFVYQSGAQTETSRITHMIDGGREFEHLEVLDGSPREVIRGNDEVKCYLPESRTLIIEKRARRSSFPVLLPASMAGLAEYYVISKGPTSRVAEHESQSILHLWALRGTPTSADLEAVDEVQANPERAIATRELGGSSEGSALLFEYLDARRGVGAPGTIATHLMSIAVAKTEPRSLLWSNSPDVFDAIRSALDGSPRDTAMLFADLAVTRAFIGVRDDGEHLPALEWAGSFGRVRFDWSLRLSGLPRRVASLRPVEPTGAMYVWLDLDQSLGEQELGFQAEWESPVSFQWALVSVAGDGRELGRIYTPFVERGTKVEQTLSDLKDARGLLIVGTNLGGVSLTHPFDPDYAPFEPHGCTVYLTKF